MVVNRFLAITVAGVALTALMPAQRPGAATGQTAAGQTGKITGHVLNAISGEPLHKAQVTLRPLAPATPGGAARVTTGDDGAFVLSSVSPGQYELSAMRTGFVNQGYGAPPAIFQGTPTNIAAGQTLEDLVIRMVPQGVIAGRVIDDDGDPVERAQVTLWRYEYPDGDRKLVRQPYGNPGTNDLGEYRFSGLPPGNYIVSATAQLVNAGGGKQPSDSDVIGTYYPRSPEARSAAAIQVPAGSEVRGIDIQLLKSKLYQIRGTISGLPASLPEGPPGGGLLRLQPSVILTSVDSAALARSGVIDSDGSFVIAQVGPGDYILQANARDAQQALTARTQVEVSGRDVDGVSVRLQPLIRVSGAVSIDPASSPAPAFSSIRLIFRSMIGLGQANATVANDGSFLGQAQLQRETYQLEAPGIPDGYYLKTIQLGGQEAQDALLDLSSAGSTDARIDLVLAPTSGVLAGTVNDSKGAPAMGVKVTVVPASNATRRDLFLSQNTDSNGTFAFKNLPPGKYRVYAWQQVDGNAWMNAEFRKPYESSAGAAELTDNGTVSVMVNLIEGPR